MGEGNWLICTGLVSFPAEQPHRNADNIIEINVVSFIEITICRPYLSFRYITYKRPKSKKLSEMTALSTKNAVPGIPL
jgi:hypothetical protein